MKNILDQIYAESKFKGFGKCSIFGGENDTGVKPDEGLALATIADVRGSDSPLNGLWLPSQPAGTTGIARRLNQWSFYCACRWDYSVTPVEELRRSWVIIRGGSPQRIVIARPVDWGPNARTGRDIDISTGIVGYMGVETDDIVVYMLWTPPAAWRLDAAH